MTLDQLPPTLTIDQAAEILGISRRSAYRAAARGELATFKIGRRRLVPTRRLLTLLGEDRQTAVSARPEEPAA